MHEFKCDVCGQPATHMVRDMTRTTEPGDAWETYEPRGKVRTRCSQHSTQSFTYGQDGQRLGANTDPEGRGIPR